MTTHLGAQAPILIPEEAYTIVSECTIRVNDILAICKSHGEAFTLTLTLILIINAIYLIAFFKNPDIEKKIASQLIGMNFGLAAIMLYMATRG